MKKVMMLAAMLAMMMVAAAPAMGQATDQYSDTATEDQYDAAVSDNVVVTQDQAAELTQDCRTIVTVNQTGTATGGDQYAEEGDTNQTVQTNIGGVTVNVTGAACEQIVNQVQAGEDAAGAVAATVGGTPATASAVVDDADTADTTDTADADATAGAVAGATADADDDSEGLAVLPDTGGISLLTLGAGALLVAGGLLARRIVR